MRSPFVTSRRFDLARLIGDLILDEIDEPLIPIMRSFSYRQKRQRAFAAEFLCPFDHARPQLDIELSEESQECVAAEYRVSPMVVRTQLVNNGLLEREALENF
jgi:Zn-dependent peptidase ImmA (M78 family)